MHTCRSCGLLRTPTSLLRGRSSLAASLPRPRAGLLSCLLHTASRLLACPLRSTASLQQLGNL